MVTAMLDYADSCGVLSIVLNARDARGPYEQFGFVRQEASDTRMVRRLPSRNGSAA